MGRISKSDMDEFKTIGFRPQELNEGNVQTIFDRCLVKAESKEISRTILFPTQLGYSADDVLELQFDKEALLKNEKNIRYLYGQLAVVHSGNCQTERVAFDKFAENYQGHTWSYSKYALMQLCYLGCNNGTALMYPFSKKDGDTTILSKGITPTLSPKDPAFPAWWEAHKGEWEA